MEQERGPLPPAAGCATQTGRLPATVNPTRFSIYFYFTYL